METVFTRFVGRSIVTDGTFVYNCGYEDVLQSDRVVRQVMDTALLGVIGSHDRIELPKKFNGYPIKLIGRVHVYEKGPDFPNIDGGWTCIPTGYRPGTWNMVLRYFPNEHSLVEKTESAPNEVILGKTKIDEHAFAGTDVHKVVFSETPRKIQNYTFEDCKHLERVEFAVGLERIGFRAFAGCESLKNLVLPHTVNHLQEAAFRGSGLETVVLSSAMTKLTHRVFADCPNLETVVIPPSIQDISNTAFRGSPKVQITGFKNSFAHQYAIAKKIDFVSLEEMVHLLADEVDLLRNYSHE